MTFVFVLEWGRKSRANTQQNPVHDTLNAVLLLCGAHHTRGTFTRFKCDPSAVKDDFRHVFGTTVFINESFHFISNVDVLNFGDCAKWKLR